MANNHKMGMPSTSPESAARLLQHVVDNLPEFIFWKDLNSVYLGCNQNFAKVAGLSSSEEVVGKSDYDLAWSKGEADYFRLVDRRVMDSAKPEYDIIEPQKQSDGKSAWLETNKIPLFDDMGNVVGILGTFEDVTEKKNAEDAAQHAKRLESIGKLAGGVAHDFNNLLGGIIGATEILQSRISGEADQALLQEILRTAERAADLTGKLLAFSRRGNAIADALSIHEAIDNVSPLLRRGLDSRIQVEFSLEAARPYVMGDSSEIELALLNLGLNARDAMPHGGALRIVTNDHHVTPAECEASPFELTPGPHIRIHFEDTGTGIHPDVIDEIFEPFFTTKEQGAGTGLGLSAVYGAVQAHGGSIEALRDREAGACFVITLPTTDPPRPRTQEGAPEPSSGAQGVALLADDESLLLNVTGRRLEQLGFDTLRAGDGEEALRLFAEHESAVTLVLLDVVMPVLGGLECLERIREHHPQLPIILCSGFAQDQLNAGQLNTQSFVFLKKPYDATQLNLAIKEAGAIAKDGTARISISPRGAG